jgi:hypothetical protein
VYEGFVEIFAEQSKAGGVLDIDEDNTPPEMAENYVQHKHPAK